MVNVSDLGTNSSFSDAIGAAGNILSQAFSPITGILRALGIVLIVYIIVLIIKAFLSIKTSQRIKKIAENVEEINLKLNNTNKSSKKHQRGK